jgi:hypothetical protein
MIVIANLLDAQFPIVFIVMRIINIIEMGGREGCHTLYYVIWLVLYFLISNKKLTPTAQKMGFNRPRPLDPLYVSHNDTADI